MDSLNMRINIFLTSGIINGEEADILNKWVEVINENCSNYEMEILERLITHSAMMMKRKRDHESLEELNDAIYEAIKADPHYEKGYSIFEKLNAIFEIPEVEKRYIILHVCTLLAKES